MEGINGKKRFTLRFVSNNNQELSFGDHNPNSNDDAYICRIRETGNYVLKITQCDGKPMGSIILPDDTLICNGWYPEERDDFVSLKDFPAIKDFVWK